MSLRESISYCSLTIAMKFIFVNSQAFAFHLWNISTSLILKSNTIFHFLWYLAHGKFVGTWSFLSCWYCSHSIHRNLFLWTDRSNENGIMMKHQDICWPPFCIFTLVFCRNSPWAGSWCQSTSRQEHCSTSRLGWSPAWSSWLIQSGLCSGLVARFRSHISRIQLIYIRCVTLAEVLVVPRGPVLPNILGATPSKSEESTPRRGYLCIKWY